MLGSIIIRYHSLIQLTLRQSQFALILRTGIAIGELSAQCPGTEDRREVSVCLYVT